MVRVFGRSRLSLEFLMDDGKTALRRKHCKFVSGNMWVVTFAIALIAFVGFLLLRRESREVDQAKQVYAMISIGDKVSPAMQLIDTLPYTNRFVVKNVAWWTLPNGMEFQISWDDAGQITEKGLWQSYVDG